MDSSIGADTQPIIVKRKKYVKADEHHGGAWKVAYADFVTAMMAFFLLMWLLNATTEEQRKGLADYFNPTIPISRISGGGSDGLNGSSIFTEETFASMGTGATRQTSVAQPDPSEDGDMAEDIAASLEEMKADLAENGRQLSEHLLVKHSAEGVILELVDTDDEPLFSIGRRDPTPLLYNLLQSVSSTFDAFGDDIKIIGHTDSLRYRNGALYDNWDLSAARANTARRLLLETGFDAGRIMEVSGRADTDLLSVDDPLAAQNRRISIVILTG